jgi:hypothetical protein
MAFTQTGRDREWFGAAIMTIGVRLKILFATSDSLGSGCRPSVEIGT